MRTLQQFSAWLTDDPLAQMALSAVLATLAVAVIVAVLMAGLRPLIRLSQQRYRLSDPVWSVLIRLSRWVIGLSIAAGAALSLDLPWLAAVVIGLTGAEGAESVWGWAKSLARLAGARVSSLVGGNRE